ncbi:hypothetical protein PLIIFM63780_001778 [Purpureocillium lilacinum]|nr:hypothetical protein PLIIFM63780_001778 [Purpureocillium lilacinum]
MKLHDAQSYPPAWNLRDTDILVRFIVYSYVLSKYKAFSIHDGGVACRLRPELACKHGRHLIEKFWDSTNREYKEAKPSPVVLEFAALQTWMSELSCAWVRRLSTRVSTDMLHARQALFSLLARDSVRVSAKGMAATACFPTYLLVRDFWARSNCGIILVDRHFCPKGFHYNLLTVRLRHRPGRRQHERGLPAPVHWDVEETSLERLSEADDNEPHIIVVGNSINGSSADYLTRLLASGTSSRLSRLHHDDACAEAAAHARKLRAADHERLAKASLAAHPSYCIELEDRPNEPDIIHDLLEQAGQSNSIDAFRHMWERSAAELGELGGGQESLRMFCWQHVFADTKRGLAEMLRNWIMHVEMDSN